MSECGGVWGARIVRCARSVRGVRGARRAPRAGGGVGEVGWGGVGLGPGWGLRWGSGWGGGVCVWQLSFRLRHLRCVYVQVPGSRPTLILLTGLMQGGNSEVLVSYGMAAGRVQSLFY